MDDSREYLKMCRESREIQEKWVISASDCCYVGARDLFSFIYFDNYGLKIKFFELNNGYNIAKDRDSYGIVWLPYYRQIITIILNETKESNESINSKFNDFIVFIESYKNLTKEKLWLMYYMYLKKKKIWKDGRWIKSYEYILGSSK